jgi:demethylmenaquinone methyltransferase / 2-methoxy-6-polyprenyl-1,4-benzoquinol methylase
MVPAKAELVRRFFTETGPSYDSMVKFGTFGFDILWKKNILKKIPASSERVLDLACGTGIVTFLIARRLPRCHVVGVDITEGYLAIARKKAARLGIPNVEFIQGPAEEVLLDPPLDCVTSSYLPKYADLDRLTRNVFAMLREGGIFVMHDFTYPSIPWVASAWEFYFKVQQAVGVRFYPAWRDVYEELPNLIRTSTWVRDLCAALKTNGFTAVSVESLTLGGAAVVVGIKPRKDS